MQPPRAAWDRRGEGPQGGRGLAELSEPALEDISRSASSTYADIRIPLVSHRPRPRPLLFTPRRFFPLPSRNLAPPFIRLSAPLSSTFRPPSDEPQPRAGPRNLCA